MFKEYFDFEVPTTLAKKIYKTKDKKENDELVKLVKIIWSNLKDEIEKMSKKEIENEKPDKILKIVQEILSFNKQKQLGLGLKILTPNQMLSRLPITLAQLKARKNSEKLKNYCILCTDQKNLQSNSIKVWLTLFKNGNNLYKH